MRQTSMDRRELLYEHLQMRLMYLLPQQYFAPWARIKVPRTDHIDNVEAEDKLISWLEEQLKVNNMTSSV